MRNTALKTREIGPDVYLPFGRHVTDTVISLTTRALLTVIRLDGTSFETAETADLNDLHAKLNLTLRNVADPRLALWTHLVRRRTSDYPDGAFRSIFAASLDAQYREQLRKAALFRNDLYLTLVWHPARAPADAAAAFFRRLGRSAAASIEVDSDALKRLNDATRDMVAALERYGAHALGLAERDGITFSEPMELLHAVASGEWMPMPLPQGPIGPALYSNRVIFGREAIEIRSAGGSRFAGMFGLKEYPASTRPGLLNALLSAPFELVVTQSFAFLSKADAKTVLTRKQNQLVSAQDPAASQIDELGDALDDLESNRFALGDHHLSLQIYAATPSQLQDHMSVARRTLADAGAVVAREDLGLEAAYWAQLPGLFKYRARTGAISSRNFAAFSPFHTYPTGQPAGNHWGPAVAMLKTASGSPFYFSFHHGDLGNTFICGPSGSGKTVVQNFLLSQAERLGATYVFFDKDRGAEIFVRAAGGTYLTLRNGVETGCAPLKALELTPANLSFLGELVRKLVTPDNRPLTVIEEERIDSGLRALAHLRQAERSFGALRAFLGQQDREGIGARLERWCRGAPFGWVLDGEQDAIGLDARFIGFDMTDLLDHPTVRTPLMMYLFYRVERLIDGRRLIIDIDEFWKALGDEAFRDLANNKLKTIRKQNGVMVFGTQSPRDALASPIAHTIVEQCPTQIFLPNARGMRSDYVDGFHLTDTEFRLIKEELAPESRRFLVKQGHNSVVAELDLGGFDDALAVLSGRTETVELLDRVRAEVGDDPAQWLPVFQAERRAVR
ncbi:VirB4 family type IV secretion/conjugal transfer ATPase (plasmid) [Bradyrhizobium septentrionale]|uniref:Type IV secretion system protein virB4 n=1 Tax=Bradyrhizobium septentrionale TaxID=1404411 RepID=A0A974A5K2_9BRAD|nr:VirB4 family type IV secretion/conjugal transfer ATPase [Bradyrhizobium septentrionale]UGY11758.1 VirB4 family type IV secretion/conjugal transfer ATPase [Bradyrhizobium septentrionale]UGY29971.1 VirB4 family type IV secretion/conjugal transfer ATPase [Bradyrhizobium septentrionale]